MTPEEFKKLRETIGMSEFEFAVELGYSGSRDTCKSLIWKYETGQRSPIPTYIARLAYLIAEHHRADAGSLPEWPESCAPNPPKPPGVRR